MFKDLLRMCASSCCRSSRLVRIVSVLGIFVICIVLLCPEDSRLTGSEGRGRTLEEAFSVPRTTRAVGSRHRSMADDSIRKEKSQTQTSKNVVGCFTGAEGCPGDIEDYATLKDLPGISNSPVNCKLLFRGDENETIRALQYQYNRMDFFKNTEIPPGGHHISILSHLANCKSFKVRWGFLTKPVSKEEKEFPLAFSIAMYKDPEQVVRLLRAVYRPQNIYCIHIDSKANDTVRELMEKVVDCFPNVFLSAQTSVVNWGYFSVLQPDLHCLDELVTYKKWKYFINLTGQEFPLKTNLDIVRILKVFQGANDIPGSPMSKLSRQNRDRIKYKHRDGRGQTKVRKEPFPHNITMAKGSVHILASRAFVEYVVNDPVALEFREWCRDTGHASEHFFNSLEYSPQLGVPGAYTGDHDFTRSIFPGFPSETMTVTRWKEWSWYGYKCQGKFVHSICIIGVGDLPALYDTKFLFVNKLHAGYHPLAYSCLEELHFNRTRDDILGQRQFDLKTYSKLPFVQDRLRVLNHNIT